MGILIKVQIIILKIQNPTIAWTLKLVVMHILIKAEIIFLKILSQPKRLVIKTSQSRPPIELERD